MNARSRSHRSRSSRPPSSSKTRSSSPRHDGDSSSREERKAKTRRALLDSALDLLEEQSFSSLSLREVARGAGVVPTAFYRHFESMEELGLALIDESFRALRDMIREARAETQVPERVIRRSVEIVVQHVREHRAHFQFIARERNSGLAGLRHAIRAEIRLITSELATDLARFPYLREWSTDDLNVIAALFVNAMVSIVENILESPDTPEAEATVKRVAEKQLTLIILGVPSWRSTPVSANVPGTGK